MGSLVEKALIDLNSETKEFRVLVFVSFDLEIDLINLDFAIHKAQKIDL
jgi:hypothetical protein